MYVDIIYSKTLLTEDKRSEAHSNKYHLRKSPKFKTAWYAHNERGKKNKRIEEISLRIRE